jgi:cytochrome c peroxidase
LDWDGRAKSLEDQLRGVFAVAGDMGIELGAALENILGDSRLATMFWRAFKRAPDTDGLVTAIASFQRSLVLGDSRFDRFLFGGDSTVLSPAERRGWVLFSGPKTGCGGCHVVLQPDPRGKQCETDTAFIISEWVTQSAEQQMWDAMPLPETSETGVHLKRLV